MVSRTFSRPSRVWGFDCEAQNVSNRDYECRELLWWPQEGSMSRRVRMRVNASWAIWSCCQLCTMSGGCIWCSSPSVKYDSLHRADLWWLLSADYIARGHDKWMSKTSIDWRLKHKRRRWGKNMLTHIDWVCIRRNKSNSARKKLSVCISRYLKDFQMSRVISVVSLGLLRVNTLSCVSCYRMCGIHGFAPLIFATIRWFTPELFHVKFTFALCLCRMRIVLMPLLNCSVYGLKIPS